MARHTCMAEEGDPRGYLACVKPACGKPAIGYTNAVIGKYWLCAEHYDAVVARNASIRQCV